MITVDGQRYVEIGRGSYQALADHQTGEEYVPHTGWRCATRPRRRPPHNPTIFVTLPR